MMRLSIVVLAALMLAACSEKPQTTTARKADDKPWDGAATAYTAQGYKGTDQAAWEQQMRQRAQGQNEYSRAAAKPQ